MNDHYLNCGNSDSREGHLLLLDLKLMLIGDLLVKRTHSVLAYILNRTFFKGKLRKRGGCSHKVTRIYLETGESCMISMDMISRYD